MVKEASSVKKRKGAIDPEVDVDIYQKVVNFEEKEAQQRSPSADAEIYFDTCNSIRGLLEDIYKLKTENKKDNKPVILQKRTEACILTAHLKKLNRLDKVRMLSEREALNQEKQKLDTINLQFQNLLYELGHLTSESMKCNQYKSKDEDIELVTVDEFLDDAASAVTLKFKDKPLDGNLKHDLHLAMLEHELNKRIQLSKLCDTLETKKKQLGKDIVNRKEILDGLGPRLSAVIEATKPLQEHLGMPIDKIRAEHKLASLLPDELYLLYCNGDAYKQVNDVEMTIEIIGDQEEAVQYIEAQKAANEQDSELEVEVQEEPTENKKRRHRKASQVDKNEEKKKKLVEPHPLSLEILMSIKDGPVLKIKFLFRPHLKIVTVLSSVEIPPNITGNSAREVLSGDSILNELFEGDIGKESPNTSNHFQLKKVGLGSYESLFHKLGYAYNWAQKICGLDFLDSQNYKERANKISQTNVEAVFKGIQKRLRSRFALAEQLQQLEQNCISAIPDTVDYPKTAVSTLTKWTSTTFQKFCNDAPNALELVESEVVSVHDLFYNAIIARPKATLLASVIIKNDYPLTAPMFLIKVKFNGLHTAENSDEIRDMERAVNIGWDNNANTANWLLSAQLRYLCSFLDVYLETTENSGFAQSTVFFRNVCARNRRRPFKYRKLGNGIFTQY